VNAPSRRGCQQAGTRAHPPLPALRDEYITIEAHLDGAVDTGAVDGDAIDNSADDDATGSAATLAIAERMIGVRPKRSLIFSWDSGEERGLWGTRHFVDRPGQIAVRTRLL